MKTDNHLIEISCEVSSSGAKTRTPVQLATEGDGSLNHWLASFRSALIAAGFDAHQANALKIDWACAKRYIDSIRNQLEENNG